MNNRYLSTLLLLFLSGFLTACQINSPENPETLSGSLKNTHKNTHHLDTNLQKLIKANQALEKRITQLEQRQSDLERSISVISTSTNPNKETKITSKESFLQAQKTFTQKNYPQTIQLLNAYAQGKQDAQTPDALWLLAQSHRHMANCESAIQTSKQLTRNYPQYKHTPDVLYLTAQCQSAMQQKDSAKETLRYLIATHPYSPAAKRAKRIVK